MNTARSLLILLAAAAAAVASPQAPVPSGTTVPKTHIDGVIR